MIKVASPPLPFHLVSILCRQQEGVLLHFAVQIDLCALNKRLNLGLEANARVKVLAARVASEGVLSQVLY